MIQRATGEDSALIMEMVEKEFPYKKKEFPKIGERLDSEEPWVFKKTIANETVGFVDFSEKDGRGFINAVWVKEGKRKLGFGKELLEFALAELAKRGMQSVRLLVKHGNMGAKRLYSNAGFSFSRVYEKKIDGSIVEIWEKTNGVQ